jgi:hypothetical protein
LPLKEVRGSRSLKNGAPPPASLWAAACLFAATGITSVHGADPPPVPADRVLFTQIPSGASGDTGLAAGSRVVVFDPSAPDAGAIDLTPGFHAAGRPDLSFDGQRVLFVGRRVAADPLGVWEMAIDGSAIRPITDRSEDVARAIYLSSIYTLDADEPALQIAFAVARDHPGGHLSALYTARRDGSRARRITFNPYGASDPHLLSDGRLLYASGLPATAGSGTALFTVHPDGTDVSVFAAAHEPPAARGMACETDDGHVVYVESAHDAPLGGGALVAVARTRSLHTRRVIAPASEGVYHSPSALAGDHVLVSYRSAAGGTYGLYVLDAQVGARVDEVFDSPDWDDVEAVVIRRRVPPPGRSSVVDERVRHGFLYCLDAYLTDRDTAGKLEQGEIKRVRIFRSAGDASGDATGPETAGERVLGEVPVRPDGSVYLQIPARTALRLETVGEAGHVLQTMHDWIWVMPGERRGCVGCHEDRELTPPNRYVLALREQPVKVGIDASRDTDPTAPLLPERGHGE